MIGVRASGLYQNPEPRGRQRRCGARSAAEGRLRWWCSSRRWRRLPPRARTSCRTPPRCRCWSRPTWSAAWRSASAAAWCRCRTRWRSARRARRRRRASRARSPRARRARSGIHWALAPVADVNNNPDNPVINIRSFGEDPELVARLAAAFVAGRARRAACSPRPSTSRGTATPRSTATCSCAHDRRRTARASTRSSCCRSGARSRRASTR